MEFSDISSFSDDQVSTKLQGLKEDEEFHRYIASLIFPQINKYFPKLIQIYVRRKFEKMFGDCKSIAQFQSRMAPLVERMIKQTTDGFSYSGIENLSDQPTLFIGNHRDISLDPAFLNYLLYRHDLNTVRIAIGDNLLDGGFVEVLMRLNKSFIVHRNIKGVKETLRKLSKLSTYINHSLNNDNESIWIAQKEGRANDGNDFTDEGVLKMLYLDQRKNKSVNEWVKDINLTPIVISYEYDPLDVIKAKGWDFQENWTLDQINKSDLSEMAKGIFGYKGRVHLHVCKPILSSVETIGDLSNLIENEIISNYHIWPSNHSAFSFIPELESSSSLYDSSIKNTKEYNFFKKRFSLLDSNERTEFLMTYARPLINKEKARLSPGP